MSYVINNATSLSLSIHIYIYIHTYISYIQLCPSRSRAAAGGSRADLAMPVTSGGLSVIGTIISSISISVIVSIIVSMVIMIIISI